MSIAYWCVFTAVVMPYVFTGIAKAGTGQRYDNQKPREFLKSVSGYHQRAHWAQLNSFETFPAFAAAVIIAHQLNVNQYTIDIYALSFIAARVLYGICYLCDWATLRSLCWMLGIACVLGLFVTSSFNNGTI